TEQQKLDAAGCYPISAPVLGKDGNLYGVSGSFGLQWGAVYRISPAGDYKGLYMRKPADTLALGSGTLSLTAGTDGNFYGTPARGGLGWGGIFKLTAAGAMAPMHRF